LYAGVGYGTYGVAYNALANEYTITSPSSYYCPDLQKGLEAEGGVKFVLWEHLSLSAGYNTIFSSNSQRFADIHLGIGVAINK
jgi:hypothetical protein